MFKGLKYRIYPTNLQKELIAMHIGSSRFIYNLALETKKTAYLDHKYNFSSFELIKQLPELKKEYEWLKNVNSQSLQQSIQNMDVAFKRFYKGAGFPKYKSKIRSRQSFSVPQRVSIVDDLLIIPKFNEGIKIVLHRPIKGIIKSVIISTTSTGKYFASILVNIDIDTPNKAPITERKTIGIDLGVKTYLVASSGLEISNPKNLHKAQSKLKFVQRKYAKNKGKRTRHRLAILHEKVVNKRKDFLHKTSSKLIKNHDSIAIEDLNIKGMLQNHNLARAISDVSWSTFVEMLEYKAEWYGKNILTIGRFEPSSKTCSHCGEIKKELTLSDRDWTCNGCGTLLDRDLNASINIKSFALKNYLSGEHTLKNRNELPVISGVLTSEAQYTKSIKGSFTPIDKWVKYNNILHNG